MSFTAPARTRPKTSTGAPWRPPRGLVYLVGVIPAAWILFLGFTNQLGANPIRTLEQELGIWTLRFLIATLTVTPLRDLFGINLLRYRRALGLLTFYYALMHLSAYLLLDYRLDFAAIGADIVKRPYITFGMLAFAILIPLALTSTDRAIRRLGKAWSRLHRWVYLAAAAAALHFVLVVKSWPLEPLIYAAIIAGLLGYRFLKKLRRRRPRAASA
ncbi:protein-methionine-sulfoxide reductase heme-binding subunit MsrQ [Chelativorans sp. SCAU2101]|jgi:Predicted membrane protein|uniref:Protein-methionine-sulfoxide reductase heme-binding subunit MsrQ n=1 Tax=Chelativorans petroleitrophicus TaxID=2975484 RepID=A0A9X2X8K4_9HYPH|nr:protein-methionine-sulfoxide reductase heme-binding subunit MsrQ [Chelativorans petroleitrophicus]MCT8990136.1 protein-methionine-sulfoxide reductase heme-binding subunit MsrQ [Chelativorans petroleitrophicus]